MSTDDSTDVRWMTYDEMSEALGITPDSARRLAARNKHWPRRPGNDGRTRVGVPADRIPDTPPDAIPDDMEDDRDDINPVVKILTQHIERLEKELETVKSERDEARILASRVALLEVQHDSLKTLIEIERRRADHVQQQADERVSDLRADRDRLADQAAKLLEQREKMLAEEAQRAAERRGFFGWLRRA